LPSALVSREHPVNFSDPAAVAGAMDITLNGDPKQVLFTLTLKNQFGEKPLPVTTETLAFATELSNSPSTIRTNPLAPKHFQHKPAANKAR